MDADAVARRVIAIDGTSGSGKSTTARGVALRLGFGYLDTGAMYRAYAWAALQQDTEWGRLAADPASLGSFLSSVEVGLSIEPNIGPVTVTSAQESTDVTVVIRGQGVTRAVSAVSAVPGVRRHLIQQQRQLAAEAVRSRGGIVIEGRDIGSVVFPAAPVKVWLTASDQQRGLRRATEQTGDAVVAARLADDTAAALARRDNLDASRATSPARSAPGAVVIDTTAMTVDAVVDEVLELWLRAESPLRLGESASTSSDPHGVLR